MEIVFTIKAQQDITYWQKRNIQIHKKIISLLKNIQITPYTGVGKPEPLKHELSGYWSRRINNEHRLVYIVSQEEKIIFIESCKGHYC